MDAAAHLLLVQPRLLLLKEFAAAAAVDLRRPGPRILNEVGFAGAALPAGLSRADELVDRLVPVRLGPGQELRVGDLVGAGYPQLKRELMI